MNVVGMTLDLLGFVGQTSRKIRKTLHYVTKDMTFGLRTQTSMFSKEDV